MERELLQLQDSGVPFSIWRCMMLWALAVILIILWLLGFLVFQVAGAVIHLLLVAAVISIIYQLFTNRRAL
jgi:hypothetical protein